MAATARDAGDRRRLGPLILVLAVAILLRVVNLGGFSLWLDEILQLVQTRGSFAETWSALRDDPDQPPLDGLISWLVAHAGGGVMGDRLVHVAWGTLTVAVLAVWAARRCSTRVGLAAGILAAAAPFHIRYSQEIRPYSLSLLLTVAALYALDRVLEPPTAEGSRRSWVLLALASVGVVYAHHLATLFLGATALAWIGARWIASRSSRPSAAWRAGLGRDLALTAIVVVLLSLPMVSEKWGLLRRETEAPVATWTLDAIAARWEALTVAGREGTPFDVAGGLYLGLVLAGVSAALRQPIGRRWLLAALLGTVGVELALRGAGHWSNARYDIYGWPFLLLLAGLGAESVGNALTRRLRRPAVSVVTGLVVVAALAAELRGAYRYYEDGRPHWDRVADLGNELAAQGAALLASNEWTRISIAYYLEGRRDRHIRSIDGRWALVEATAEESGCAILAVAGYPQHPELEPFLRQESHLISFPSTEVRVVAVPGAKRECPTRVPFRFRREPRPRSLWGLVTRPWHPLPNDRVLDFDRTTAVNLLAGWSTFETDPDGTTFVWAVGEGASLAVELASDQPEQLELHVWPMVVPEETQTLELVLNGRSLGKRSLEPGRQTVVLRIPERVLRRGENTVDFRFGWASSPVGGDDPRQLAVAFDRLEFRP